MPIDLTVNDQSAIPLNVESGNGTDFQHSEEYILAVSPTATVTQTENGAVITIRDKNGETVAVLTNGKDGAQGPQGPPGEIDWSELDKDRIITILGYTPAKPEMITTAINAVNTNLRTFYYKNYEVDSKFAKKSEVPTKVSELANDSGYLTEHQSLSGYATESWVQSQGYLTQHQSLAAYALKSEIPTVSNDFTDAYKGKVDTLWTDYQSALTAMGL